MAVQKYTFIFAVTTNPTQRADAQPHSGGWTESHWSTAVVSPTGVGVIRWPQKRAAILPAECSIVGYRVQEYTISGNKLLPGGAQSFKRLFPGNPQFSVDVPQAGLQLSLPIQGRSNIVRTTLRGLPDEMVVNGEYTPTVRFRGLLKEFTDNLWNPAGGEWASAIRDLSQPSVRVLTLANSIITLDAAGGMVVGDYMRLNRCRDQQGNPISGSFRITAVNGMSFTLAGMDPALIVKPGGLARKDLALIAKYAGASVGRVLVKKIGAPFEKYRGRRSKRKV